MTAEREQERSAGVQGVFFLSRPGLGHDVFLRQEGEMPMQELELLKHTDTVNELLARYGVKFGIYKNQTFKEQLFPFDAIPHIIEHDEFEYLEKGLKQRGVALNLFLKDIYSKKQIVKDGVVPEEFVFASSGYLAECEGVTPIRGIYSHISGIDLVKGKDGKWYILEDNLLAFWGIADGSIDSEQVRNLIKAGKRIERIDLYARMGMEREKLKREVNRMIPRVERSGLEYDKNRLNSLKELVENTNIDYYKIVHEVESIF